MTRAAAGEFAEVLRTQISEARARLAAARGTRDIDEITPHLLRVRYLLEVTAENGVDLGEIDAALDDAHGKE